MKRGWALLKDSCLLRESSRQHLSNTDEQHLPAVGAFSAGASACSAVAWRSLATVNGSWNFDASQPRANLLYKSASGSILIITRKVASGDPQTTASNCRKATR